MINFILLNHLFELDNTSTKLPLQLDKLKQNAKSFAITKLNIFYSFENKKDYIVKSHIVFSIKLFKSDFVRKTRCLII